MNRFADLLQLSPFEGSLSTTVAPSTRLVITVDEAKAQENIDFAADDSLIQAMIEAAVDHVEDMLTRDLVERTRAWKFDDLRGDLIRLPIAPVQSITSIGYTDSNGNSQTVASSVYGLDNGITPPLIYLKDGQTWPSARGARNDVTVTFVTGYASTGASPVTMADVPNPIKHALKLIVGDLYENREAQSLGPFTFKENPAVSALLANYMVPWQ